ncbi:3' exoribonuclease family protein [Diplocarpon rosae]|nr:3' exoribonuclease family protein [Diplocarpon rosae]
MSDRRRINGPSGGTSAPIYSKYIQKDAISQTERPARARQPNVLRKMFLKTGVTPSASGSAYLELEASKIPNSRAPGLASLSTSGLKLTSSAAIADAGIDCMDVVSGGVAAVVRSTLQKQANLVLDPVPSEHQEILAACTVAYLPARDEITDLWVKGDIGNGTRSTNKTQSASYEELADNAVQAALGSHRVLVAALKETAAMKLGRQ